MEMASEREDGGLSVLRSVEADAVRLVEAARADAEAFIEEMKRSAWKDAEKIVSDAKIEAELRAANIEALALEEREVIIQEARQKAELVLERGMRRREEFSRQIVDRIIGGL